MYLQRVLIVVLRHCYIAVNWYIKCSAFHIQQLSRDFAMDLYTYRIDMMELNTPNTRGMFHNVFLVYCIKYIDDWFHGFFGHTFLLTRVFWLEMGSIWGTFYSFATSREYWEWFVLGLERVRNDVCAILGTCTREWTSGVRWIGLIHVDPEWFSLRVPCCQVTKKGTWHRERW